MPTLVFRLSLLSCLSNIFYDNALVRVTTRVVFPLLEGGRTVPFFSSQTAITIPPWQ